jgi:quinol monooxygenase YgiN
MAILLTTADDNSKFATWVQHNEPATYTYSVLVRDTQKASVEVMMFERYRDAKAIAEHGGRKEFKAMFKEIAPFVNVKATRMAEWEELEGSWVGEAGKGTLGEGAKL